MNSDFVKCGFHFDSFKSCYQVLDLACQAP
jgi:hypothetical protein